MARTKRNPELSKTQSNIQHRKPTRKSKDPDEVYRGGLPRNEKEVTKQVITFLKSCGWTVVRNQQNIGSEKGIADYIILKHGCHIWLEIKGPKATYKGKGMEDQLKFMQKIHDAGGNYVCTNGIVNLMNNITFKHQKSIINLLVYGYYKEGPEEQEYERVVKIMDEALYEKANKTKHGVIVS